MKKRLEARGIGLEAKAGRSVNPQQEAGGVAIHQGKSNHCNLIKPLLLGFGLMKIIMMMVLLSHLGTATQQRGPTGFTLCLCDSVAKIKPNQTKIPKSTVDLGWVAAPPANGRRIRLRQGFGGQGAASTTFSTGAPSASPRKATPTSASLRQRFCHPPRGYPRRQIGTWRCHPLRIVAHHCHPFPRKKILSLAFSGT
jgi:hypothetical protein